MKKIFMDVTLSFFISEGMSEDDVNLLIDGGIVRTLPDDRKYVVLEQSNVDPS